MTWEQVDLARPFFKFLFGESVPMTMKEEVHRSQRLRTYVYAKGEKLVYHSVRNSGRKHSHKADNL
jgi:hypothetical protein